MSLSLVRCVGNDVPDDPQSHTGTGGSCRARFGQGPQSQSPNTPLLGLPLGNGATTTLWGGRTVGVVVDMHNRNIAYTLSETGGVYKSIDRGKSWISNVLANGSPGPIGRGLARGLTTFDDIAIDPFNSQNLLLLVEDDNRLANSRQGIWQSSDGAATWHQASNGSPPCSVPNSVGHIKFSPDQAGIAFVTTPCRLGMSTDHGVTWSWISPVPSKDGTDYTSASMDGIDVVPSSTGDGDRVYLCLAVPTGGARRSVAMYNPATRAAYLYPTPPTDKGGNCSIAVNPVYNGSGLAYSGIFVATGYGNGANLSGICEGLLFGPPNVAWTNLSPPGWSNTNGRPAAVQVQSNGSGFRLYYGNTTLFLYEDCSASGCPQGPNTTVQCPADTLPSGSLPRSDGSTGPILSGEPWHCLFTAHADLTKIAFDPAQPDSACPMLISSDGGIERSTDCGTSWETGNVGLHVLQPYETGFAGQGSNTRIIMATQDNGIPYSRDGGGTWTFTNCGDGFTVDVLRTTPDVAVRNCNGYHYYIPDLSAPSSAFLIPTPPNTPLNMTLGAGWEAKFVGASKLIVPTLTSSGTLQLKAFDPSYRPFDPTTRQWSSDYGAPLTTSSFVPGCCGDMAIGGRLPPYCRIVNGVNLCAISGPQVYVVLPPQPVPGSQAQQRQLWCGDFRSGTSWRRAAELVDPVRVWASEGDGDWAYAYDQAPSHRGLYVTRTGCAGPWAKDVLASQLLTNSGEYNDTDPAAVLNIPITGVGFDPGRPGRAAIGTHHNGILLTQDYGASWAVSHAFPEPNGGATSFYFDDSGLANGTIEETDVAGWGRGVWAVHFGAGALTYTGVPSVPVGQPVHLSATLADELGQGVSGQHLTFVIHGPGGSEQVTPDTLTDQNGVLAVDAPPQLPPGDYTVDTVFAGDAGRASITAQAPLTIQHDVTPPTTTAAVSPEPHGSAWVNRPVQVTLSAVDDLSGVAATFYAVDDPTCASDNVGTCSVYAGPFTISTDGQHTVSFFSKDNAGNFEAVQRTTVSIDSTPPQTTATLSGTQVPSGGYVGPVQATLAATDTLSGVASTLYQLDGGAWQPYTSPFTVSTLGLHSVTYYSIDNPGAWTQDQNFEAQSTTTFVIYAGPPVVTPASTPQPGTLLAWGGNDAGQLGNGSTTASASPAAVSSLGNVVGVAAGPSYSLALRADGTVWAWGRGPLGQWGQRSSYITTSTTPVQVGDLSNVIAVAAGGNHGLALKVDGTVWAWGTDFQGQLGDGTTTGQGQGTPVQVEGILGVVAIAAGYDYSLALTNDGTVWAWGNDSSGQLGSLGLTRPCGDDQDGTPRLCSGSAIPTAVLGVSHAVAIAAGTRHALTLASDGTVWAWGDDSSGQLGTGTISSASAVVQVVDPGDAPEPLRHIMAVAAGGAHSLALSADGTVWAWGSGDHGQLGSGSTADSATPVQVSGLSKVVAIAAGTTHSVAATADGTAWAWGGNDAGQLGTSSPSTSSCSCSATPVQVAGLGGVSVVTAGLDDTLAIVYAASTGTATVTATPTNASVDMPTTTATSIATPVPSETPSPAPSDTSTVEPTATPPATSTDVPTAVLSQTPAASSGP